MDLSLTAFGQSDKFTLKERSEIIMEFQSSICELLNQYTWKVYNNKMELVDFQNYNESLSIVYKQIKKGLNTGAVKIIRFKQGDIAPITSNCSFVNPNRDSFNIDYSIGYPSDWFPAFRFRLTNMKDENLFTKQLLYKISLLVIEKFKPEMLCVTSPKFFHSKSIAPLPKSPIKGIPWSGWFTYVSDEVLNKSNMTTSKIDVERIEKLEGLGQIYWISERQFDENNSEHIERAQKLEQYFIDNKIQMLHGRNLDERKN